MALEHQRTISVEEYFELEEHDPETRYEYADGGEKVDIRIVPNP